MDSEQAWFKVLNMEGASIVMVRVEAEALFNCVKETPEDALIVEIGTAYGRSAMMMALAGRKIITIDNYKNYQSPESPEFLREEFAEYPIEFVKGESVEVAKDFADESIDFLFIDSDHEYEAVKKDIEAWLPKVKQGGKVCFHDYGSWKGVAPAVDEAVIDGRIQRISQVDSLFYAIKL